MIDHYRKNHNIFACNGITFNHESERRGLQFVTRKITRGVADIYLGNIPSIELGNLDISRDWGYTPDYVEAMWLMLQHNKPDDYIICTGQMNTLKDFLRIAFENIGITDFSSYIKVNQDFIRTNDINLLQGNPNKIKTELGWSSTTNLDTLIRKMVINDIKI
jgi:GDPmannose 4,6-dehydratase